MEREHLLRSSDQIHCGDEEATPSFEVLLQYRAPKFHESNCAGRKSAFKKTLPWILHIALLSASLGILAKAFIIQRSLPANCMEDRFQWTITMGSIPDVHHYERLIGTVNRSSSPFKGPPSPAVDAAWAELTDYGAISISEATFEKLNASKNAVRVPAEYGGGRMAFVEAIHQLHCLESLWQHTYPDYYIEAARKIRTNNQEWHEHMDHCVDMLRHKLMCDADVHLITYNWLKRHDAPHPNFNTARQCRDFESVKRYVSRKALDGSKLPKLYFEKPKDGSVMEYEEPPFDPLADGWPSQP